jgi:hypothetical protein
VEIVDDGDPGAARGRWDLDYDGTWDSEYEPGLSRSAVMPAGGAPLDVKVEVMDADGWTGHASARIGAAPAGGGGAGGGISGGAGGDDGATTRPEGAAGCGCNVPGRAPSRLAGAALVLALAGLALRRRLARPRPS